MSEYLIVGDVAGQHKTLLALMAKSPAGCKVLQLGDVVDRGMNSPQVVQWFIDHPDHECLYGNHEALAVDYLRDSGRHYGGSCWLYNGGTATLDSYGEVGVPKEHIDFLASRKKFIELKVGEKNILLSHAFANPHWLETGRLKTPDEIETFIWSRNFPTKTPKYDLQLAGHNSNFGYKEFKDEDNGKTYAICLDTSRSKVLTGLYLSDDTVEQKLYQQPYID